MHLLIVTAFRWPIPVRKLFAYNLEMLCACFFSLINIDPQQTSDILKALDDDTLIVYCLSLQHNFI